MGNAVPGQLFEFFDVDYGGLEEMLVALDALLGGVVL